jgi:IS1 family transposase
VERSSARAQDVWCDAFDGYDRLWYPGDRYQVPEGKRDTYVVEGDNAVLRHYLARLARRSRCFSSSPEALVCALQLFIYCFKRRQLFKQRFPK